MIGSAKKAGEPTGRVAGLRAGAGGCYVAVLIWVFLSGCGAIPTAEPSTTEGAGTGLGDMAPSTVVSNSTVPNPDVAPSVAATEPPTTAPEQEEPAILPTPTSIPPTAVTSHAATLVTTTGPAAVSQTDEDSGIMEQPGAPRILVLDALPHDPAAFTQGLVLHDGMFYESTGLYGASTVRIVDPETGAVISSVSLDERFFGEGLEVVGGRVVQLTWKEQTAFVWEVVTLEPLGTYAYDGEGWGLCAFDDRFVMSDGSSTLTFRDLNSFQVIGRVEVVSSGQPVDQLNELECVGEFVYANVWFSDEIIVIDADSGKVVARVDASSLRGELSSSEGIDVLNGIAHDPDRRVFYLTGKLWPEIFEVRIDGTA